MQRDDEIKTYCQNKSKNKDELKEVLDEKILIHAELYRLALELGFDINRFAERINNILINLAKDDLDAAASLLILAHYGCPVGSSEQCLQIAMAILGLKDEFFEASLDKPRIGLALTYLLLAGEYKDARRLRLYCYNEILGKKGLSANLESDEKLVKEDSRFNEAIGYSGVVAFLEDIKNKCKTDFLNNVDWATIYLEIRCLDQANEFLHAEIEKSEYSDAWYKLGLSHLKSDITPVLNTQAYECISKAAQLGHTNAFKFLREEYADKLQFVKAQVKVAKILWLSDKKATLDYLKNSKHKKLQRLYCQFLCNDEETIPEIIKLTQSNLEDISHVANSVLKTQATLPNSKPWVRLAYAKVISKQGEEITSIRLVNDLINQEYAPSISFANQLLSLDLDKEYLYYLYYALARYYFNQKPIMLVNNAKLAFNYAFVAADSTNAEIVMRAELTLKELAQESNKFKLLLATLYHTQQKFSKVAQLGFNNYQKEPREKLKLCYTRFNLFSDKEVRKHIDRKSVYRFLTENDPYLYQFDFNFLIELISEQTAAFVSLTANSQLADYIFVCNNEVVNKLVQMQKQVREADPSLFYPYPNIFCLPLRESQWITITCVMLLSNPQQELASFKVLAEQGNFLAQVMVKLLKKSVSFNKMEGDWLKASGELFQEKILIFLQQQVSRNNKKLKTKIKKINLFSKNNNNAELDFLNSLMSYFNANLDSNQTVLEKILYLEKLAEQKQGQHSISKNMASIICFLILKLSRELNAEVRVEKSLVKYKEANNRP